MQNKILTIARNNSEFAAHVFKLAYYVGCLYFRKSIVCALLCLFCVSNHYGGDDMNVSGPPCVSPLVLVAYFQGLDSQRHAMW